MEQKKPRKLHNWTHVYSGKVRDIYVPADVSTHSGRDVYLIVASDRISAYDYVLPTQIPDKGAILTQLSLWWFDVLADIVENHVVSTDVPEEVKGRAMITRRLNMFPIECVVRGYLTGSGLAEYCESGSVCGVELPAGLQEASQLGFPIFTPAAKAKVGGHDENITFADTVERVGLAAHDLRSTSIQLYQRAHEIALQRGIIIADTKFEFGVAPDSSKGNIILADEVLTPDSSRFWYAEGYEPGRVQPSLDKQFVRDWLTSPASGWDRKSGEQPPELPEEVVEKTRERYIQAYETLTGSHWQ
ncbi:MAG: phosphoribosylaminoimidazolesuccinocarboxamide synthase [Ancrocorticia sp.]|nr:phosphoribosylaminoimidazolesuccinocarboxamide synthase [Ancrocorticia sp.]MCI1896713.1 phosphoribosylaminoimidazolesuccinocarboxamide synthase [Ancrocorticia sp.]MCI1933402.1 phosphoribosylaminoimidazolesuccinocarboxamide synthase [Ancrocorticia sp.]MCI1962533.1 phosphoribosylaminoimidazolesuccinocarboxamide synthase [Ancrocorticia sp.]MCI2002537.1 phosphoribosylaminoimidazolesuccinocarboxamide synthase [Ancrocorticia sp.]